MTVTEPKAQLKPEDFISGEAAPGIERVDVQPVGAKVVRDSYAVRQKIYAKLAHGRFRTIKWVVLAATLGIYYVLPWLRWDRGPHLPNQAFLLDFANQRLFFGPFEIWAQELYFITGILVLSALGLFLVTSLAGRVWCGYACPQTVWTDLMIMVERFWQGDRNQRMRLDKQRGSFEWIWKKTATHISWLLVGLATGGAFVFYFRDAPTLGQEFLSGTAPAIAYLFLGIFAVTTYLLGGIAREQVCIYMCPWPRIQGAMLDQESLLVSYETYRGEPRGPHRKGQTWEGRGDCIDCKACVAVCPMGIDIRDGAQLECIQCALCIDACDEVMDKVGRPRGLIAYDTISKIDARGQGGAAPLRLVRPRTVLYGGLMALVSAIMLWAWSERTILEMSVIPDRNPLFVAMSDGSIRNGFTIKILNKRHDTRSFRLAVDGLPSAKVSIIGMESADAPIEVVTDNLRALRVFVAIPPLDVARMAGDETDFRFVVTDLGDSTTTSRAATFRSPGK